MGFEAEEILTVKIARGQQEDSRHWRYHPKGIYTVSSGYYVAAGRIKKLMDKDKPSSSSGNSEWWNSLWKLAVPLKLKIF